MSDEIKFLVCRTDMGATAGPFPSRAGAYGEIEKLTARFPLHAYYIAEIEGEYGRQVGPVAAISNSRPAGK